MAASSTRSRGSTSSPRWPAAAGSSHHRRPPGGAATIEVFRHDAVAQRFNTQKITFTAEGIRMLRVALRYSWPSELDLMARNAGLELTERHADWDRRPFASTSPSHISVYRPA
jgi:hypothetical protein